MNAPPKQPVSSYQKSLNFLVKHKTDVECLRQKLTIFSIGVENSKEASTIVILVGTVAAQRIVDDMIQQNDHPLRTGMSTSFFDELSQMSAKIIAVVPEPSQEPLTHKR